MNIYEKKKKKNNSENKTKFKLKIIIFILFISCLNSYSSLANSLNLS